MIKPFLGDGGITAWLTKVELVATLLDLKEDDLVKVIPLYLALELAETVRSNTMRLNRALVKAFLDSPFTAFSKLKGLRWVGEPVGIFAT